MKTQNSTEAENIPTTIQGAKDKAALKRAQATLTDAKKRLQLAKGKHKSARKQFKDAKREAKRWRQKIEQRAKLLKAGKTKASTNAKNVKSTSKVLVKKAPKVVRKPASKPASKKKPTVNSSGVRKARALKPLSEAIQRRNIPERKIGAKRAIKSRTQETAKPSSANDQPESIAFTELVPDSKSN